MSLFIAELRSRYDWSEEELVAEWEAAKTNPKAIWSTDDYGAEVCSLLKKTTSSSARELVHRKGVSVGDHVETNDVAEALTVAHLAPPAGTASLTSTSSSQTALVLDV